MSGLWWGYVPTAIDNRKEKSSLEGCLPKFCDFILQQGNCHILRNIMGQGRRMKRKQGAPDPLSEEHFARLKRKAGIPVDETEQPAKTTPPKRRRTAKKAVAAGKSKKLLPDPHIDENRPSQEGNGDALTDEPDEKLGDDFIGSEDSVVDSDEDTSNKRERFVFSDDEDDSDKEEVLTAANIEGLSKKLDQQLEKERTEADAEVQESALQTNLDGDRPKVLGAFDESNEELGNSSTLLAPDLQLLRQRIMDIIRILGDFSKLAEEGRSRADYTSQLLDDICAYYNYSPFLAEKLYNLFTPREAFAFFESNEAPRPIVIRTNTLRTHRRDLAQALINRGVTLEPVGKWSKVGLQVFESSIPLGATPEYLAGHYILQAASSFLPVMALSPQPGERVLDMAAAPGGKTTHCAAMMKNTGVVVANDPNKARAKGLIGNIHRLGAKNVIVCSYDAREFPRVMGGFDRVLLDAPCSGTGVIAKDPSVKTNKTERDFMTLPHTQKQLLLSAIDSVNHAGTGGYIVYSTCSVTVEENEQVVAYALSRRPNVRLVDTELPFGKEGFTSYMGKTFDPSLKLTRRYYPHTYNVDGFYVAKFKKIGPTPASVSRSKANADEPLLPADKAPIVETGPASANGQDAGGDFGGFDENEDKEYMERAKRSAMRRRGLDPRSLDRPRSERKKNA
ncbi:25S rRNA (cytosine-C(5))-methyltransferase nop2 [Beauveria bassiana]|nr:25S rRNA (cytosine-C(5))-methyltransferase nop2 [Beauveria bassiana]KAH8715063.1 25S rRNA (cytosine-C(5))-methyltransferase nop2 [Beauveria bassiana]